MYYNRDIFLVASVTDMNVQFRTSPSYHSCHLLGFFEGLSGMNEIELSHPGGGLYAAADRHCWSTQRWKKHTL